MKNDRLTFEKSIAFTQAIERRVPGGAHTYSKGRDQFPKQAPSGISRGAGARVWDIDGNELVDWSMGLTSVSLGHGYQPVVDRVSAVIQDGVNFQRPAALELEAAESILSLTGGDMVKFARHGSSVTTAAVKLSRGFTGRSKIAVPEDHPFFSFDDWFIGSTAADFGIPEAVKGFTVKFRYNDIESLHALFAEHRDEIACVMLEPVRFEPPENGFLEAVRALCDREGAVLVFDEMVTGLKIAVPGAGSYFGVVPDLSTWGKGIANGFAAAALTGRGDILRLGGLEPEGARRLFLLSTTHGAESVGLAAMMATLDQFRDGRIVAENWTAGADLRSRIDAIFARYGLQDYLKLTGYPCLFLLESAAPEGCDAMTFRTLLLQELIAWGVLFQSLFVITPSHGPREIEDTVSAFDRACEVYRQAVDARSVEGLLEGPAIKPVFRRTL